VVGFSHSHQLGVTAKNKMVLLTLLLHVPLALLLLHVLLISLPTQTNNL